MDSAIKKLLKMLQPQTKSTGTDYTATVTRVEGNTAYVQMTGADINDTPVAMTINANVGDQVRVRVNNGRAWITGNDDSPPTNDSYAKTVDESLSKAVTETGNLINKVSNIVQAIKKVADNTNQYFWHVEEGTDTGTHITEIPQDEFLADPENAGGNLLARSNGIALRDGLTELATFTQTGMNVKGYDEMGIAVELVDFNFNRIEWPDPAPDVLEPYWSFGERDDTDGIGDRSFTAGFGNAAPEPSSAAFGRRTITGYLGQMAIGQYNAVSSGAFVIGNGSRDDARSNAMEVDWQGNATFAGSLSSAAKSSTCTVNVTGGTVTNNSVYKRAGIGWLFFCATGFAVVANNSPLFTIPSGYRPYASFSVYGLGVLSSDTTRLQPVLCTINASTGEVTVNHSSSTNLQQIFFRGLMYLTE